MPRKLPDNLLGNGDALLLCLPQNGKTWIPHQSQFRHLHIWLPQQQSLMKVNQASLELQNRTLLVCFVIAKRVVEPDLPVNYDTMIFSGRWRIGFSWPSARLYSKEGEAVTEDQKKIWSDWNNWMLAGNSSGTWQKSAGTWLVFKVFFRYWKEYLRKRSSRRI